MRPKRKGAFSLIEMLVTMAIFGIMTVLLLQSLLLNIQLSGQINARAQIRTELDEVTSLIERDIRNATKVGWGGISCQDTTCPLVVGGSQILWSSSPSLPGNPGKITKKVWNIDEYVTEYQTGALLDYKGLNFVVNTLQETETAVSLANIFVTIKADAANAAWRDNWHLVGQFRQITVSTRNYTIN